MKKNKHNRPSEIDETLKTRLVRKVAPALAAMTMTAACSFAPEARPEPVVTTAAAEALPAATAIEREPIRQNQFTLSEILAEDSKMLADSEVITATSIDYGYDELSLIDTAEADLPILSVMDIDGGLTLIDKSPNGVDPEFLTTIASLFAIDEARYRQVLDAPGVIGFDFVVGTSDGDTSGTFIKEESAVVIELPYESLNESVLGLRSILVHEGFHAEGHLTQAQLSDEDLNLVCGQLTSIAQQELTQSSDSLVKSLEELERLGAPIPVIEPIKQAMLEGTYYDYAHNLVVDYRQGQGFGELTGDKCYNGGVAESVRLGMELNQPGSFLELMGEYDADGFSGKYSGLDMLHHDLVVDQTIFKFFTEQSYGQSLDGSGWPYRNYDELQASLKNINYLFPEELAKRVAAIQDPDTRLAVQQAIDFVLVS